MKKSLIAFIILPTALITGNSFAATASKTQAPNTAANQQPANGLYITGQIGYGNLMSRDASAGISSTRGGVAGGARIGYLFRSGILQFGPEIGFNAYADNTYKSGTFKATYAGYNLDLMATLKANLSDHWHIFGKAGAAYAHQKLTSTAQGTDKNGKIYPKVALGFGYNFNPHLAVNVSTSYIFGDRPIALNGGTQNSSQVNKVAPVATILAGVTYTFGDAL